jgi:hypothetical protein
MRPAWGCGNGAVQEEGAIRWLAYRLIGLGNGSRVKHTPRFFPSKQPLGRGRDRLVAVGGACQDT